MDSVQLLSCFVLVSSIGKCILSKFHAQSNGYRRKPQWYWPFLC